MITDFPLPPSASRPPCLRNQTAPWNRQVYVGEYFMNSAVVGSSRFSARTRLGWLAPRVSMPEREKPTADSSSSSSAPAWVLMVFAVVEKDSRIDRMSCAAMEYAWVVSPNNCQS